MINLLDWFDIDNIKHIQAYEHLQNTGVWPKDFLPDDVKFTSMWRTILADRLADRFVEEKLSASYYEDYSYYVGGEMTCGRMPLKYGSWIAAGRPA